MGSSGRGRALTRVSRGVGLGWCGWVRGLSEKRAPEVGGNKGGGHCCHFVRMVSGAVEYGYLCRSNYRSTHGPLGGRHFLDALAIPINIPQI